LKELQRRGIALPEHFSHFVARHNPTLLKFEHVPKLIDLANRVVLGTVMRLLVVLPPRYFKSEIFSRLLPAFFLRQNPHLQCVGSAYGADLAWSLSEEARTYYQQDGGQVLHDTKAKKHWKTHRNGKMHAAGVGGPLLGFGYHLGIVDDPTDPEKAASATYQKRFSEWWPSKWLSRQEPNARIIVVMQRLGMDDPIDFLLRREIGEGTDQAPEHWHVAVMDEVKSPEPLGRWTGPRGLPPTCTLEPDWRETGRVLAPSRFSPEQVERLQLNAGAMVTSTQRQQRPMAPTGDFWRKDWFRTYTELPSDAYDGGKDWDTAYTKDDSNAASAFVESYRGAGAPDRFPIYIQDADWDWIEFPELVAWMQRLAGPHYVEQKATGKSAVQALHAQSIAATEVPVKGDKMARSALVQPVVSNRRIYVRETLLHTLLYGERQGLLRVTAENLTTETGDLDLNDCFVQAVTRHVGPYQRRIKFL
jgi:hypothetical protein